MLEKMSDDFLNKVPGAQLSHDTFEAATIPELKRWLKCRGAATSGRKGELVAREKCTVVISRSNCSFVWCTPDPKSERKCPKCKTYAADPSRVNRIINPDTEDNHLQPGHEEHLTTTTEWSRSLDLPAYFGEGSIYAHLGGKTEKHRISGYSMFKCGKVENIMTRQEGDLFGIKGMVGASYSRDRYFVHLSLNSMGKVVNGKCQCKAGTIGKCKHVGALLFQVNEYRIMNKATIPEDIACTQKPRQWNLKKSKPPTISKKFENLVFVKYAPGKAQQNIANAKRRSDYCCLPPSKRDLPKNRLNGLASAISPYRQMWSEIILESISEPELHGGTLPDEPSEQDNSNQPIEHMNVDTSVLDLPSKKNEPGKIHSQASSLRMRTALHCYPEPQASEIPQSQTVVKVTTTSDVDVTNTAPTNSKKSSRPGLVREALLSHPDSFITPKKAMEKKLTTTVWPPQAPGPVTSEPTTQQTQPIDGVSIPHTQPVGHEGQDSDDLESLEFYQRCKEHLEAQKVLTNEEVRNIEQQTRGQASNPKWFQYREGHITALMVGDIVHRRQTTPPDALVGKICRYDQRQFNSASCAHGVMFESEAREEYIAECHTLGVKVKVGETGLLINQEKPWFGASPDGVVLVEEPNKDVGLLEIKCPYVPIHKKEDEAKAPRSISELACQRKYFYLTPELEMNQNHKYYFQTQAQMGIARLNWCDFVVYYKVERLNIREVKINRVHFDKDVYDMIVSKVDRFYLQGVVPELLTRRIKNGRKLYPNSTVYRYSERVKSNS